LNARQPGVATVEPAVGWCPAHTTGNLPIEPPESTARPSPDRRSAR
jgi:hypothetical protein